MLLQVTRKLHGKPSAPKTQPGQKQKHNLWFPPLAREPFLERNLEKNHVFFLYLLRPSLGQYFIDFCFFLGVFFWRLLGVVVKFWKARFCNIFHVKSQIPRVCWLRVWYQRTNEENRPIPPGSAGLFFGRSHMLGTHSRLSAFGVLCFFSHTEACRVVCRIRWPIGAL